MPAHSRCIVAYLFWDLSPFSLDFIYIVSDNLCQSRPQVELIVIPASLRLRGLIKVRTTWMHSCRGNFVYNKWANSYSRPPNPLFSLTSADCKSSYALISIPCVSAVFPTSPIRLKSELLWIFWHQRPRQRLLLSYSCLTLSKVGTPRQCRPSDWT